MLKRTGITKGKRGVSFNRAIIEGKWPPETTFCRFSSQMDLAYDKRVDIRLTCISARVSNQSKDVNHEGLLDALSCRYDQKRSQDPGFAHWYPPSGCKGSSGLRHK
jgi:hypothetical protein